MSSGHFDFLLITYCLIKFQPIQRFSFLVTIHFVWNSAIMINLEGTYTT